MSTDINLIKQSSSQRKTVGKILIGLYFIFGIFFLAGIGLLLYSFSLQTVIDSGSEEKAVLTSKINVYQEQKDKILVISERLSSINNVISQRAEIDKKLEEILTIIPDNISIDAVNVIDELVAIRLRSARLSDFDDLIESGIPTFTARSENQVKLIEVGQFAQSSDGYSVSLDFYYDITAKEK